VSKKIWITVAVVFALLAGVCVWAFGIREREGIHDERILNPSVTDLASYEGRLVHSADEFDAGVYHLTGWYVVKKQDGTYVRRHVATWWDWDRLAKAGRPVIQFPADWMDKYLPVEGEV
jgi:hypothetical protein